MKKHILEYYEYQDIINLMCEFMDFPPSEFRNYHRIIGGGYKDLWHIWVDVFHVENDSYQYESFEDLLEYEDGIIIRYGEWAEPFFRALEHVRDTIGDEITIHYSW